MREVVLLHRGIIMTGPNRSWAASADRHHTLGRAGFVAQMVRTAFQRRNCSVEKFPDETRRTESLDETWAVVGVNNDIGRFWRPRQGAYNDK